MYKCDTQGQMTYPAQKGISPAESCVMKVCSFCINGEFMQGSDPGPEGLEDTTTECSCRELMALCCQRLSLTGTPLWRSNPRRHFHALGRPSPPPPPPKNTYTDN